MSIFTIVILSLCGIYMVLNLKHDIHMLQQNSYRPERYWRWLRGGDMGNASRLADVALIFLLISTNLIDVRLAALLVGIVCVIKCALILRKKFKKPLVFTRRVWRIYSVAGVISVGAYVAFILTLGRQENILYYSGSVASLSFGLILCIFSWVIALLSVVILTPVEKSINQRYWNDANRILRSMPDMKIVGITGSYGKTSTKHYLHRILSEQYETLMTPGSYNTPMGVIRTVREMMKPYTEVFICEMGAKQKGDIKEICDLVHPHMGIVTAVGPMHLQTFKTIENVQSTKFELVDALPSDGLAVVNNDFEYCANRPVNNVECVRYAVENIEDAQFTAEDIVYSADGTTFVVKGPDGFTLPLVTKLVGECNISNLLAAVIIALRLNVPVEKIQYAVGRIEQVEHRLSIRRTPGGVTVIDDAFNSNPSGSKMALDVLSHFNKDGKRIVITPGMIELGDEQYALNKAFGRHAGECADIVMVVGEYNRKPIKEGLAESGLAEENIHIVGSFTEAQTLLQTMMKPGDTILYENDLPDSFK